MKKENLLIIDNIFTSSPLLLNENIIKDYIGASEIKDRELITLKRLCSYIKSALNDHYYFDNYYINYKIPQIGKEFDLLRIGEDTLLNIELKSEQMDENKILEQLQRNFYYLSFLGRTIDCYTFLTDGDIDKLYYYNSLTNVLELVQDINHLLLKIYNLRDTNIENIDRLFEPCNYLISPFNTTDAFISSRYFLTNRQEEIKEEIIVEIENNSAIKIFSIAGRAGTGKTLLTYDIAKQLMINGKSVAVIHCAQLNEGINRLNTSFGWKIIPIARYGSYDLSFYDVLIIDESQRLERTQLTRLISDFSSKFIIFSHDVNQKLNRANDASFIVSKIEEEIANKKYKLNNKIRHNESLSSFIKKLFNFNTIDFDNLTKKDYKNINIYFTKDENDASIYTSYLKSLGWEHIYLTTSMYNPEALDRVKFTAQSSSHDVIGQEYENVVIVLDKHFYYTVDNKLSYNARAYYNPLETLFQAITRTRKKLSLVIVDNDEFYKKCIQIVNKV
jgi:hypothetical protein